ncbi:MAG: sugar phosphate nucleotidyltransferase [Candidatus Eremiobacterota bacterium]
MNLMETLPATNVAGRKPTEGTTAVVLAGGRGSRLHPYTLVVPKPLVPIGGETLLQLLLKQLRKSGVARVWLTLGYMGHLIRAVCEEGSRSGLTIDYFEEPEPLGTVGCLQLLRAHLPETFLVTNGDIVADVNLREMLDFHKSHGGVATIGCVKKRFSIDYGVIRVNGGNRITSFAEKPAEELLVNMGVYVVDRRVTQYIPAGVSFGMDDLIRALLDAGEEVHAYAHGGYWHDIGSVQDLGSVQESFENLRERVLGN